MMGVGFTEMLIVAGIALVFLGPEKFPDFAKIFIRTVRDVRNYMDDVKEEVAKEVLPMKEELKQLGRYDAETYINKLMEDDDDEKSDSTSSQASTSDTFSTDKTGVTPEPHDGGNYSQPKADEPPPESAPQPESGEEETIEQPERLDG
ncbi:MAG TPA: Sec-independent protein translocase protein TatB [Candidatus Hydrogenedentes bacterium]|nr:Sec-independent protein translocase protein TatB [Candidatus Hydrogenedentota bacterium]